MIVKNFVPEIHFVNGTIMINSQTNCEANCKNKNKCHWYEYNTQTKKCHINKALYDPNFIHDQKP